MASRLSNASANAATAKKIMFGGIGGWYTGPMAHGSGWQYKGFTLTQKEYCRSFCVKPLYVLKSIDDKPTSVYNLYSCIIIIWPILTMMTFWSLFVITLALDPPHGRINIAVSMFSIFVSPTLKADKCHETDSAYLAKLKPKFVIPSLKFNGIVMPYDDISLSQHFLKVA